MNTRLNIEKLDSNIVQRHGGSKQVGFKQLGPAHGVHEKKRVWFEVELQGAQGDREAEAFQLEDKQPEKKTNTNCLVKEQEKEYQTGRKIKTDNVFILVMKAMVVRNAVKIAIAITGSIHQGLLEKANGNVLGMEIVRDQSGNTLRVSQSRDCNVEKNGKWSCIYAVGSQEYQMVCVRLDIASIDVGYGLMILGCARSLKANLQHIKARSTTEVGYMTFNDAWKKEIWLKGLLTESRYELRLVAGILLDALMKVVQVDDPNITIEEYIRLEEEKTHRCVKVYTWKTATHGKIWYNKDIYDLRFVEIEFPAIVFNDTLTSKTTLLCEPTVSSLNDEIEFRISFHYSDDEDYTEDGGLCETENEIMKRVTVLPHLSQVKPTCSFTEEEIEELRNRIQDGRIDVIQILDGPLILNDIAHGVRREMRKLLCLESISKKRLIRLDGIILMIFLMSYCFTEGFGKEILYLFFLFILIMESLHVAFQRVIEMASGLKINVTKSSLYGVGVRCLDIQMMADMFGCLTNNLLFTYLGEKGGGGISTSLLYWIMLLGRLGSMGCILIAFKDKYKWQNPESTQARRTRGQVTEDEPEMFGDDAIPRPSGAPRKTKSQLSSASSSATSSSSKNRVTDLMQEQILIDREAKKESMDRELAARLTICEIQKRNEDLKILTFDTTGMAPEDAAKIEALK
nr:zinc finger, CCHC-type [Tanacetum cinerariifolium]